MTNWNRWRREGGKRMDVLREELDKSSLLLHKRLPQEWTMLDQLKTDAARCKRILFQLHPLLASSLLQELAHAHRLEHPLLASGKFYETGRERGKGKGGERLK